MHKSQTATEYLIILAVVIIIGVIVVVALGGIPGMGGGTGERTQLTGMRLADVGVDTFAVNCSHAVVVLKNNNPASVRVEDFVVDDIICNSVRTGGELPVVLSPGDSRTLTCTYESDSCLFRDYTSVRGVPRIGVKYSDISSGFTYTTPLYEETEGSVLGLSFNVNPSTISYNGSTQLSWGSTGAESCSASGDWSDSIGTSGSIIKSNITENQSYTLTCNFADSDDVSITRDLTVLGPGSPDPILGCTDPSANNYDSSATVDDGSCEYDPDPIPGACGSAAGQSFSSAPTTNLCAAGNASVISGNGPWEWVCQGLNGGFNSTCFANVLASASSCNQQNAYGFYDGDGTPSDPFQICNVTMLQNMQNYLTSRFVLISDIDASDTVNWNNGQGFEPIGNCGPYGNCQPPGSEGIYEYAFTGTLEGDGFMISNLYINRPTQDFVGLFGTFIGHWHGTSNIYLHNFAIHGRNYVGSFSGLNYGTASDIYSVGSVTGNDFVGGFIGELRSEGVYGYVGFIERIGFSGNVSGSWQVGGLIGRTFVSVVRNSYALANVSGNTRVGGFSGQHVFGGVIENSYSAGAVSGNQEIGGFIGLHSSSEEDILNSYYDTDISGQSDTGKGEPLTTSQMTGHSNPLTYMTGFDFTNVWQTTDSYPILLWQD